MYFYLHFNLFITRYTSANLLYVSDMLWRMWKGAQRCLRRVVTVEPFYLIQTLSAVACSICPWNRFTVVIQSFHLCETIISRRWKDLFTNVKWSDHVVPSHTIPWWNIHSGKLSPRFIGWSGIWSNYIMPHKKHVRVFRKTCTCFLKSLNDTYPIKKVVSLQPEDRMPRLIILLFIINH